MILLPHFDIPYGFGLGKIPCDLPFQGPVFFEYTHPEMIESHRLLLIGSLIFVRELALLVALQGESIWKGEEEVVMTVSR